MKTEGRNNMTMKRMRRILPFLALLALPGCAACPVGPSVLVLPAQGKPFEAFQAEEMACRQWANQQIGASAGKCQTYDSDETQRRYNNAYIQCMYSKGNQVPGVLRRAPDDESAH